MQQFFGISFLMLGLVSAASYTDILSSFRLNFFYKELKPMQERWGNIPGTVLHFISYVIAPIGFGVLFLMGVVFPQ